MVKELWRSGIVISWSGGPSKIRNGMRCAIWFKCNSERTDLGRLNLKYITIPYLGEVSSGPYGSWYGGLRQQKKEVIHTVGGICTKDQSQFWSLVLHCNFTAELWSYSIWSFKLSWDLPSGRMTRLDVWKEFVEDNTFGAFFSWFWERNIVLDSLRELWKLELFCLVILGAKGDLYWKNDWFFFLELCF